MFRRAFLPTMLLGFCLVAAKLASAWPVPTPNDLVAATAEDVAIAATFGLLAAGLLRTTRHRPRAHALAWHAVVGLASALACYAVANVAVVRAVGAPLNAGMFAHVHGVADMRSSLAAHAAPDIVAGMAVTAVAFVALGLRRPALTPTRGPRAVLVAVAAGWVLWGAAVRAHATPDAWAQRAGVNSHRELLGSLVSRSGADRRAAVSGAFPPAYLRDFAPARDFVAGEAALAPLAAQRGVRNVIVVVLESVAAPYLSLYGAPHDTTPNLVAESKHALVIDRFYANAGFTFRSMVPLVHSAYPGLPWAYRQDGGRPLGVGLAGVLRDRGHRTAFLAAANPTWGGMDAAARQAGFAEVIGPDQLGGPRVSSWGTTDAALVEGLLRWIDADPGRPFFALAWTDQTHDPYTLDPAAGPPRAFVDSANGRQAARMNRYLNAVAQADRQLGRLFAALRDRGLADDTLVVVTADHGEAFAAPHADAVGHGGALYDECQRVPLVLWNPRLFPAGRREPRIGSHVDLNPTLAHLLGIETPPHWQGASLLSPRHPGRAYMVVDLAGTQLGVVDGSWKYVLHASAGYERLFDLRADPLEQRDASRTDPARAAAMRARVSAFVAAEERALGVDR